MSDDSQDNPTWYECPSCGAWEEAWPGAPLCTAHRCSHCDDDRMVLMRWNHDTDDVERVT